MVCLITAAVMMMVILPVIGQPSSSTCKDHQYQYCKNRCGADTSSMVCKYCTVRNGMYDIIEAVSLKGVKSQLSSSKCKNYQDYYCKYKCAIEPNSMVCKYCTVRDGLGDIIDGIKNPKVRDGMDDTIDAVSLKSDCSNLIGRYLKEDGSNGFNVTKINMKAKQISADYTYHNFHEVINGQINDDCSGSMYFSYYKKSFKFTWNNQVRQIEWDSGAIYAKIN